MMKKGIGSLSLILAACSVSPVETVPKKQNETHAEQRVNLNETFIAPIQQNQILRSQTEMVQAYRQYASVMQAAKAGRSETVEAFLQQYANSAMGESVLNEYLKALGNQGKRADFQAALARLPALGQNQEVRCYVESFALNGNNTSLLNLVLESGKLPAACHALYLEKVGRGEISQEQAWRRVRGLISGNHLTDARTLAAALGNPLNSQSGQGYQENLLRQVITPDAVKSGQAAERLKNLSGQLNEQQRGFAWAVLGLAQAKQHNFSTALAYYRQADLKQLTQEQAEWYVRSALRVQNWTEVATVIQAMPNPWQQDPAWLYWLGRSYTEQGKQHEANRLYQQAAQSGRNFYAVMALEELGQRVRTQNNVADAKAEEVNTLAQNPALQHALALFYASLEQGDWNMRRQAQAEWRYATRSMNEKTILVAAQLAYQHQFYEMAINSAEKPNQLLNYSLRYLTPFRDIVERYTQAAGIDSAWAYGLMRQESRFIMGAKSSVGATGLMQVMPATAQEIARKIGIPSSELHTIEGNIRMGTWYLGDAKRRLQNNEVMATAGYNAGPSRARNWQAGVPLEGAIYAETIPFNETRDYVKKVMTNAVYYADLLGLPHTSLKQRMGVVPAK